MHHLAGPEDVAAHGVGIDGPPYTHGLWDVIEGARVVVGRDDCALVPVADLHQRDGARPHAVGLPGNPVEHGLDIESRRAHGVEHVGHRTLPGKCSIEVVEQLGVRDSDHRKVGKGLDGNKRIIGKRSEVSSTHRYLTNVDTVVDDRDRQLRPNPCSETERTEGRVGADLRLVVINTYSEVREVERVRESERNLGLMADCGDDRPRCPAHRRIVGGVCVRQFHHQMKHTVEN